MSFWDPSKPKAREKALRARKVRRMRALLDRLGSPQLRYPSVLVAGTKGKGSTCAFISEGLRRMGYRVGRYTQPHLIDWRERTWVDGKLIEPEEVADLASRVRPVVEELDQGEESGGLTTYEVGSALTLSYFAEQRVDLAVLEIGIGGGLDALNVVDPVLSVITAISLDHTDVLGDTLEEIAHEKAGIMRTGVAALSSPQRPEAESELHRVAAETGARLSVVGRDWRWQKGSEPAFMDVHGPYGQLRNLRVVLRGDHQRDNATVAVAALQSLGGLGFPVSEDAVRRGLAEVEWPGRAQQLGEAPVVVVDAAHNVDSAQRLLDTVRSSYEYRHMILVVGASSDKDVAGIARVLAPAAWHVIATSSGHRRAADVEALAAEFSAYATAEAVQNPESAFQRAAACAEAADLILITGSVFLAGKAIQVMSDE
jgi:dihydrofolate synthase / folylpolyglutamate synthase